MEINKKDFRIDMAHQRDALTQDMRISLSTKIFNTLRNSKIYTASDIIFSYVSFRSEVDTFNFNAQVLKDQKVLALPRVCSDTKMIFHKIEDLSQLKKGAFGIYEPDSLCPIVEPIDHKSLMITPGLAFDHQFRRLGYGGGFYDRYLEIYKSDISCCGVGFDLQMVEEVPHESFDILLDYIVTENIYLERKHAI